MLWFQEARKQETAFQQYLFYFSLGSGLRGYWVGATPTVFQLLI